MRISKNPHTALKTNPFGLRSFRSFICAVRFDMRLIHSNKHRPFQIVARPIRFTIRSSQNEIISFRIAHFIYHSLSWLCFKQCIKIFFRCKENPLRSNSRILNTSLGFNTYILKLKRKTLAKETC